MSYIVLIRESTAQDAPHINELIKSAYLSNVNSAWCSALFKEITFQLVVGTAAIMFIFFGVPLSYCLGAVPVVMLLIYVAVYIAFFSKAMEIITSKRAINCWVAEAYLPHFFTRDPRLCSFQLVCDERDIVDVANYQRKIIGTVAIMNNLHSSHSAWLFRLAVDAAYRKKGIGRNLVKSVQNFCKINRYLDVQLAVSECQENARQMFADCGFQLRLMYHKQLIGTALTLLMYHLECALEPDL